jgi:type IV fimbrial biogenesis protein FimT
MRHHSGFTLVELLTTVTIFTTLLSLAIPEFRSMAERNQIATAHNAFLSTIQFTRSEAIKRGNNVIICKWDNIQATCDSARSWKNGWAVFDDKNGNGNKEANEEIIRIHKTLPSNIQMHYNHVKLKYNAKGLSTGYSGTITFCSDGEYIKKQGMTLSSVGRVRIADQSALEDCT